MCYRCSLVQGVPERVPGPAAVSEEGRMGGGGEAPPQRLQMYCHFTVI